MARIFKLKQTIACRKIGTSIKDPETGDLLVSNRDIRKTTLRDCVSGSGADGGRNALQMMGARRGKEVAVVLSLLK